MSLKATAERAGDPLPDPIDCAREPDSDHYVQEIVGAIEDLTGDDRFRFGLGYLQRTTGLCRDSVIRAKGTLHALGIVCWEGMEPERGVPTSTDSLTPNSDFRVVVTPASEGKVWLDFQDGRGGSKSGQ